MYKNLNFFALLYKRFNLLTMKKIAFIFSVLLAIIVISSCDYDDSNDIDVLIPNDSTQTSEVKLRKLD